MAWNGSNQSIGKSPNQSSNQLIGKSKNPARSEIAPYRRGLLAGLVVIAIGVAAIWLFVGDREVTTLTTQGTEHKAQSTISETKSKKPYVAPTKRKIEKTGDKLKDALAEVEASGELVKIDPQPESSESSESSSAANGPKRTFKTGIEQLMGWIMAVQPGEMPIPIPPLGEGDYENLVGILTSENKIEEDDDERIAALKQDVDYCKKEMIKFIKDGGDPNEFMQYYNHQLMFAFETHNEVKNQFDELSDEDPELALQFLKRANKMLDEKGIKRVEVDDADLKDAAAEHADEIKESDEAMEIEGAEESEAPKDDSASEDADEDKESKEIKESNDNISDNESQEENS